MYSKVKHINHLEANNSTEYVMLKSKDVIIGWCINCWCLGTTKELIIVNDIN